MSNQIKFDIRFSFEDPEPYGIVTRDLLKVYEDPASMEGIIGLRGVEMDIKPGEFASVIGPSGAGKSTLLNIIGGMTRPTAGSVNVGPLPIQALPQSLMEQYRMKVVGFLWQLPERNLLPVLTAEENIEFAQRIAGYPRNKRKARTEELLKAIGLYDRRNHRLGELSGGEAQRVGLAIALANEPKVLCADEPTGELDSETTLEIIDYLKEINRDQGVTMLVVTHDSRFERITQKSFKILDGQISGIQRTMDGLVADNWQTSQREEVAYVDQFGNVRIPQEVRERVGIKNYVRFHIENNRVYLEPADMEE